MIPTAAGREQRVIARIAQWVKQRRRLAMRTDRSGNLLITRKAAGPRKRVRPVFITAHLDHPAFVVRRLVDDTAVELEFRGGVNNPYFDRAPIEIFDAKDRVHRATIQSLDAGAKPFKRVIAKLEKASDSIQPGDVGRWLFANLYRPGFSVAITGPWRHGLI